MQNAAASLGSNEMSFFLIQFLGDVTDILFFYDIFFDFGGTNKDEERPSK